MCRSSSNDEAIISLWVKITAIWQSNFPSTMTIETFPPTKISVTRWHTFWLKFGRGLFSQKHQYYIKISPLCTKTDLNITDIQSFGVWILAPHFMLSGHHSDKDKGVQYTHFWCCNFFLSYKTTICWYSWQKIRN